MSVTQETFRGPKEGYGFSAKEGYREHVWREFAANLHGVEVRDAIAVFMPGPDGAEIPVALSHGFSEKNLIAVDENPALLAAAKWRKSYPGVRVMGGKVSRVFERMRKEGIAPHAINLDLCNALSIELFEELEAVQIVEGGVFALTVQKGRESRAVHSIASALAPEWQGEWPHRLTVPLSVTFKQGDREWNRPHVLPIAWGEYRSGASNVYMQYGIIRVDTDDSLAAYIRDCLDRDDVKAIANKAVRVHAIAMRLKDRPASESRYRRIVELFYSLKGELEKEFSRSTAFTSKYVHLPKVLYRWCDSVTAEKHRGGAHVGSLSFTLGEEIRGRYAPPLIYNARNNFKRAIQIYKIRHGKMPREHLEAA